MGNCVTVKKGDKDGATIENKKPPKAVKRGDKKHKEHKDSGSEKSDDKKHEKPESELPQSK